jgi:hypothetical protein
MEAQLRSDRDALAAVEAVARAPLRLPSVGEVLDEVFDVLKALREDPARAREAPARWLRDGRIKMELGADVSVRRAASHAEVH